MDQSRDRASPLPLPSHRHRLNLGADEAFDFDVDQQQQKQHQEVDADDNIDRTYTAVSTAAATTDLFHAIMSNDTLPAAPPAPAAAASPPAAHSTNNNHQSHHFLDDIIVGYAFGPKKMETMGIIMAEASKALSTVECSTTTSSSSTSMVGKLSSLMQQHSSQYQDSGNGGRKEEEQQLLLQLQLQQQQQQQQQQSLDEATTTTTSHFFSDDEEEDTRSWSSTRSSQQHLRVLGGGGGSSSSGIGNHGGSIQLTFLTDENGAIHLVRTGSSGSSGAGGIGGGGCGGTTTMGDEGETTTGTSVATTTGTPTSSSASCSSSMLQSLSSCKDGINEGSVGRGSNDVDVVRRQHPIRVSFVPIDLETPLEEQHGGKFDVILHKLTEDILCMSKMLRDKDLTGAEELDEHCTDVCMDDNDCEDSNLLDSTYSSTTMMMSRRQARASIRIQRLRDYKQNIHPSCVLVDSPNNILAVMSRAEMAKVLSRCLAGVTTRGGIPVRTPRFLVVEEDEDQIMEGNMHDIDGDYSPTHTRPALADEIDNSGLEYPLIAKPLTAAGTKSSHHMGIVLARDGLQRLKTPCLLQEFANHGEKLFKVYVLGESVWVFSRESLPNLPMGEKCDVSSMQDVHSGDEGEVGGQRWPSSSSQTRESYVEFERPAGSNCYVEFNSQRPYPKLSDFGILSNTTNDDKSLVSEQDRSKRHGTLIRKRQRRDATSLESCHDDDDGPIAQQLDAGSSTIQSDSDDLARFVTNEELEPVTNAIRDAFGLKLFGFDVIVKHDLNNPVFGGGGGNEGREILVVDVNYFPGYKEVPNFPSLLAQYLTQKAVESRIRNFDGS